MALCFILPSNALELWNGGVQAGSTIDDFQNHHAKVQIQPQSCTSVQNLVLELWAAVPNHPLTSETCVRLATRKLSLDKAANPMVPENGTFRIADKPILNPTKAGTYNVRFIARVYVEGKLQPWFPNPNADSVQAAVTVLCRSFTFVTANTRIGNPEPAPTRNAQQMSKDAVRAAGLGVKQ